MAAKVYNALLLNRIRLENEKILWKNQKGFWTNRSTTSQILTIHQIIEGARAKNFVTKQSFVDFPKHFSMT